MFYFPTMNMGNTQYKQLKVFFTQILFVSLIVLAFIFKFVNTQQCSDLSINKKYFGQRLVGYDILTTTESSVEMCARKCFQLTHCLSLNFDTVSDVCDLKNTTLNEQISNSFVQDATSIFSDISDWPKAMAGPCGNKPCSGRDICLPAGNSFLCRNSDCPNVPVIDKTTSTGSVEIGGKMVYLCTLISQHHIIHCGWMNTWSPSVDIACIG